MKATTTTPKNVYQMVTDRIIAQMEKGIIPWQKPWRGLKNANPAEVAISYETRRAYSFLNQCLLGEPGEYLTFNQIKAHGGMIRKGERSRIVVFYTMLVKEDTEHLDENGDPKVVRIPVLKYYNVWNINQVDGIESKGYEVEPKQVLNPEEAAEAIVDGYMASENTRNWSSRIATRRITRPLGISLSCRRCSSTTMSRNTTRRCSTN